MSVGKSVKMRAWFLFIVLFGMAFSNAKAQSQKFKGIQISDNVPRYTPCIIPGISQHDAVKRLSDCLHLEASSINLSPEKLILGSGYKKEGDKKAFEWKLEELFPDDLEIVFFIGPAENRGNVIYSIMPFSNLQLANTMQSHFGAPKTGSYLGLAFPAGIHVQGTSDTKALKNSKSVLDVLFSCWKGYPKGSSTVTSGGSFSSAGSLESRLLQLKKLKDNGLINEQEYNDQRKRILRDL